MFLYQTPDYIMAQPSFIDWKLLYQPKQNKSRVCSTCLVTETSCWYRDKTRNGHLCRKCYTKQNLVRVEQSIDGTIKIRSCITCQAVKTTSWYHSPKVVGSFDCIRCYQKRRKQQRATSKNPTPIEFDQLQFCEYVHSFPDEMMPISS